MSKRLILEDYNDNERQENYAELRKFKQNLLDPNESARERNILRNLILSLLVFGSVANSMVQWSVLTPISSNTTRLGPEATIFHITKDLAQLIASPFVGVIIDKMGPDVPYFCGGIIMFLSTAMLAFWQRPVFFLFARVLHGLGSSFTEISTIVIIANMFTTTITRSKWFGIIMTFASFGFYLILRRADQAILLILAFMPFINGIAACKALFNLKAEEAKEFQITKPASVPIWKLLIDPYIMICAGALIVSNIPLVFLLKIVQFYQTNNFFDLEIFTDDTAFLMLFSHTLGIALTVPIIAKFSSYRWLITLAGLTLEGLSCFTIPFIDSNASLEISTSVVAFGVGMVRTAMLPTFACIMEIRHAAIYGNVYAIANAFYSLAFIISPLLAYLYLGSRGFTTIAVSMGFLNTLYAPILFFLRRF